MFIMTDPCQSYIELANKFHPEYGEIVFVLGNEHGIIGAVEAYDLQEALDNAADNGLLDHLKMNAEDYKEYSENGWDDDYITAGNASEPFWSEYLWVYEHPTE